MKQHRNLTNIIWRIFLAILLVLFMLLSMNSLLPLKWRFPAWKLSPHLEQQKRSAAEGTRIDFVNSRGDLTVALDKNYATVIKTMDQDGNCVLEQYFDRSGKPAVLSAGYSAFKREFNKDGKWICTTYLDDELRPIAIQAGYAEVHRTYNSEGKVETESYFGTDGQPAPDSHKKFGVRYEYDGDGHITVLTCLDAGGNAMNNKNHYAVIRRTYTPEGKLYTQMFYDKDGQAVIFSYGQSGYLYEKGRTICLDRDGNRMFVLRHFLLNSIPAVLLSGVLLLLLILFSRRAFTWILLVLYLAFIAYMTIINREAGISVIKLNMPPNYYLFFANREILSNVWLFIPLGAILYKLFRMWEIMALPFALTLLIESSQLIFDIGAFELSDLVANSLGGVIGIVIIYLLSADSAIYSGS